MLQQKSTFPIRSTARLIFSKLNPILFHTIAINEFPKSGGTWVCKVIADYYGYSFKDNEYPIPGKSVIKYHQLNISRRLNEIIIIRDPRDVFISYYYHVFFVFKDQPFNKKIVDLYRERFDFKNYSDIENNIQVFIPEIINNPMKPNFNWGDFYNHKTLEKAKIFRYEDLRKNPRETFSELISHINSKYKVAQVNTKKLESVLDFYDIDQISRNRKEKSENLNFVRKGLIGEWRKVLSDETNEFVLKSFKEVMKEHGYSEN